MKIKIKSFNGDLPDYLTVGKVYEVIKPETNEDVGTIISDDGYEITLIMEGTSHLNGGSWEVVDEQ